MSGRQACKGGVWFGKTDSDGKTRKYYSPTCRRKSCEKCAKYRKLGIVMRILSAIEMTENMEWWFCTITLMGEWHTDELRPKARKKLAHVWSVLRKRIARKWSVNMWVKVYEHHQDGTPHAHFIIAISKDDEPITTAWLKDNCEASGGGYIDLVGTKENPDMPLDESGQWSQAWYVAKYTAKGDMQGIRAISWSQNFPELLYEKDLDLSEWDYEGASPKWDSLEKIYKLVYATERNVADENEREGL